ncbi:MAG TPA: hypothetical protein VLY23_13330 [Candidatus Acidoferrum sp.]|nr:hypothetical protein [Candidatus Acidoferrum sp.]
MRKRVQVATVLCLLAAGAVVTAAPALAAGPERYLHVKVEDASKGESVNVNVPLSMAEKILPTINNHDLHNGRVTFHHAEMNGIDVRALLDAVRTAPDNEFVTVKEKDADVRVAKANGNIVIHVVDKEKKDQTVDVTVPMKIVDALLSTAKDDELDVAAALHALSDAGDVLLVTVQDASQKVRVWVDSRNTQE